MEAAANTPQPRQPPIALQYREQFIDGVKQGKNLADIIRELGLKVSTQAISKILKSDGDYQDAKEDWHTARINRAEGMIEGATESVDVARARAYWQSVTWRAEREFPERWGAKQEVNHVNSPVINFVFGGAPGDSARVIDSGATFGATVIESQDESK